MNKLKTYFAVILYLATNSVYAERELNTQISHLYSAASTLVCGLFETNKTELSKLLETSSELDCTSKEDITEHCTCIKKVTSEPLSTPVRNKYLAELGFMSIASTSMRASSLSDLAALNAVLGTYGPKSHDIANMDKSFFSCLEESELDQLEENLKKSFKDSAETKMGVPALYRPKYIADARASNKIKMMDTTSREADAQLISDISKYIAEKEGPPLLVKNPIGKMPAYGEVSSFTPKSFYKPDSDESQVSTKLDADRAALVVEFLHANTENRAKYALSPLFKVYARTYDRSRTDIGDYLGRIASKTGLIDSNKRKISSPRNNIPLVDIVREAAIGIPVASYMSGECYRIKEEIKKNASSNYIPDNLHYMVSDSKTFETMSYDNILRSQEDGRNLLDRLDNIDPDTEQGKRNINSIKLLRENFKNGYAEHLKVFDDEKADLLLKAKDFNFSQLICSKIEIDIKVEEVIHEIENDKDSGKIIGKVQETKNELTVIDDKVDSLLADRANSQKEIVALEADNKALENRRVLAEGRLKVAKSKTGHARRIASISSKSTIETTSRLIDENNLRIEQLNNEISQNRIDVDNLFEKRSNLRSSMVLSSKPKLPIPVVSLNKENYLVDNDELQNEIRKSLLDFEIKEFVPTGVMLPTTEITETRTITPVPMFTGKVDKKESKVLSLNRDSGEIEMTSKATETQRTLKIKRETLSEQILAVTDKANKDKATEEVRKAAMNRVKMEADDTQRIALEIAAGLTKEESVEGVELALNESVEAISASEVVINPFVGGTEFEKAYDHKGAHISSSEKSDHSGAIGSELRRSVSNLLPGETSASLAVITGAANGISLHGGPVQILQGTRGTEVGMQGRGEVTRAETAAKYSTGTVGDEVSDDEMVSKVLNNMKKSGLDISALEGPAVGNSNHYEKTIESKTLQEESQAIRREVMNKRGKLKGLEVGNIGLSKKLASQRRSVSKIKDYSNLSAAGAASDFSDPAIAKARGKEFEKKADPSSKRVGQKGKDDQLVDKTAGISVNKNLNQEVLNDVRPETNRLAAKINNELNKTKAVKAKGSAKVARRLSPTGSSGSSVGPTSSSSGGSSGGGSAPAPVASNETRAPANIESKKALANIKFDSKALSLNAKTYEVSPVLEGVDDDLYVRLPNFDTPKDFLKFSVAQRNKWIAEQFKSSKALEAIIVLPSGKKVLVKKKD